MDRFLDEQDNPAPMVRDRSSSPSINSLIYGDPKRHNHNNEFKVAIAQQEDVAVAPDVVKSDAASEAVASPSKVTTSGVGSSESVDQSTTTPRSKRLHPQHEGVVSPASSFHPISSLAAHETPTSTTKALIAKPCPVAGDPGDVSSLEPCAKRAKLITNDICDSVSTTSSVPDASQTTHYCDSSATTSVSSPTRPVMNGPTTATSVTAASLTKLQETITAAATPMLTVNGEDHVGGVALSISSVGSTGSAAVKLINDARISPMPSKSPSPMSTTAQAIPVAESLVQ